MVSRCFDVITIKTSFYFAQSKVTILTFQRDISLLVFVGKMCCAPLLAVENQRHIVNCRLFSGTTKKPFTLRLLSTFFRQHFAFRSSLQDSLPLFFRGNISSHCQSTIFQTIIVKWHGTQQVEKREKKSGDEKFINIFTGNSNFSFSLPFIIQCAFKNKSSLGFTAVFRKSRYPPSKQRLIVSVKLFQIQTMTCVFFPSEYWNIFQVKVECSQHWSRRQN